MRSGNFLRALRVVTEISVALIVSDDDYDIRLLSVRRDEDQRQYERADDNFQVYGYFHFLKVSRG